MTITPRRTGSWFGFTSVAALIGIGLAFVPFDVHAGADGHVWDRPGYVATTLAGMAAGALTGLTFGWLLHATIHNLQLRRRTVRWLWGFFFCGICIYLILRPAIYAAR